MAESKKTPKELTPEDKVQNEYNQRINDLKEVVGMHGGAGIRFLRRIMNDARIYQSAYKGNVQTTYILGKHDLANAIIVDLEFAATRDQMADILLPGSMVKTTI